MLYLGVWFLAADCVSVLSIGQNVGLEETRSPCCECAGSGSHTCLLRNDYLEVFRRGRAVICKGQEHTAFEIISSYSSSLQGRKIQILSREELGAQPAILTKNIAPVKSHQRHTVAFVIKFCFFPSSFAGCGEGPALLGEQNRKNFVGGVEFLKKAALPRA